MNKKKISIQIFLFVSILFLSLFGYVKYPKFFSLFENRINDIMFMIRGEKKADSNIIIIDIDEKSLKELGQWPWSRNVVAKILQNLTDYYHIGIVGLDIVFAEYDNSSPKRVLKKLDLKYQNAPDYDMMLAKTIESTPTIVGYVFSLSKDNYTYKKRYPKNSAIIIEINKPKTSYLIKPYRAILNIPPIQKAAYSNGYFNTIPDADGIVRSIPMLMNYDGILYPSLSLEMTRLIFGAKKIVVNYFDKGVESIQIGKIIIPTDIYGRMMINYKGAQHKYQYISAVDIYKKNIDKYKLEGKIALMGTSAAGLLDLRSTPFDSVYPGVEVHATALDNMINGGFLSKPSWIEGVDFIDIVFVLLVVFGIVLVPNALISFILFVLFALLFLYFHFYMMVEKGLLLNTIFPLVGISLLFILGESINYFFETRQKEKIKKKFAQKVSPAVVEELIKSSEDNVLEGKEKEITIFFSDIRSFTTISEKLGSAKELISLLNEYMTPMVEIITKHQGTVDKFIGDAIMAYWNAPLDIKQHADKALSASIEQILRLNSLNEQLALENKPRIDIGIGLNSGLSVVGEMGSYGRSDYTCIGDPVNLASRTEGLCKPYGAKIIITEFTKKLLKNNNYFLRELDIVRVKGKEKPVSIYECMGFQENFWVDFDKIEEEMYYEALYLYRNSNFENSLKILKELHNKKEQKLYQMYINRCVHYLNNPPKDFDGVFTFLTK